MGYWAHILQASSLYISKPLCKVWGLSSSWFKFYWISGFHWGYYPANSRTQDGKSVKKLFLRTVVGYKAHILQDSSLSIHKPLCKVRSLNSSWFMTHSKIPSCFSGFCDSCVKYRKNATKCGKHQNLNIFEPRGLFASIFLLLKANGVYFCHSGST